MSIVFKKNIYKIETFFLTKVYLYDNISLKRRGENGMFGKNLMYARKQRGFTLERLADVYNRRFGGGLSKGTLSKYENNKQEPMISTAGNLSAILGVSVDYLLNGEESDYIDIYAFDNISPVLTRNFRCLEKNCLRRTDILR